MGGKAVLIVGAVVVGAGWWVYHARAQASAQMAATHELASVLCDSGTLARVVDAYPQSHMSRDELGQQTVGAGLQRVNEFRRVLPALVDPIVPDLQADRKAWTYMADVAKRMQSPRLYTDPELRSELETFTHGVATSMKSACPAQFQSAATQTYAQFGIGAVLGDLGRLGN
jgi:hypothetical protein